MARRVMLAPMGLAAVLVVATAMGACSSPEPLLDRASTQLEVGRAVAEGVAPAIEAVSCPGEVPAGKGESFRCAVELADGAGTLPVAVDQVDDDGTLKVTPGRAVLTDEAIAEQLKAGLGQQFGRSFQADCGDRGPSVRDPDDVVVCQARDKTSRRSVEVTIVDTEGTLSFEVLDPN